MKGFAYLFLSAFLFATAGIVIKLFDNSVNSLVIAFYRVFFGFLVIFVITLFMKDRKKIYSLNKKEAFSYILISLLVTINVLLLTYAYSVGKASNVILVNSSYVMFVFLFGYFLLKDKITKKKLGALLLTFIGLVIINPLDLSNATNIANFIALIASIFAGLFVVLLKKEDISGGFKTTFWMLFFGFFFTLPFLLIYGPGNININNIFAALWLGIFSYGIAYLFYNKSLETLDAESTSILDITLRPIILILLAYVVLGEVLTLEILIGGFFLILGGVYMNHHTTRKKKFLKGHSHVR